jgi:hypothetical protein
VSFNSQVSYKVKKINKKHSQINQTEDGNNKQALYHGQKNFLISAPAFAQLIQDFQFFRVIPSFHLLRHPQVPVISRKIQIKVKYKRIRISEAI